MDQVIEPIEEPPAYDPELSTWLMSHGAQHQDMMLACQNTADITGNVQQLARSMSPEQLLTAMDAIGTARERIGLNVAPLLALEAMAISLRVPR